MGKGFPQTLSIKGLVLVFPTLVLGWLLRINSSLVYDFHWTILLSIATVICTHASDPSTIYIARQYLFFSRYGIRTIAVVEPLIMKLFGILWYFDTLSRIRYYFSNMTSAGYIIYIYNPYSCSDVDHQLNFLFNEYKWLKVYEYSFNVRFHLG